MQKAVKSASFLLISKHVANDLQLECFIAKVSFDIASSQPNPTQVASTTVTTIPETFASDRLENGAQTEEDFGPRLDRTYGAKFRHNFQFSN